MNHYISLITVATSSEVLLHVQPNHLLMHNSYYQVLVDDLLHLKQSRN